MAHMFVHLKFLTLHIATLLLVTSSSSAQTPAAAPPNRFIESECDNSQRINVRFAADSATILYRGRVATLRQQPSGSGYRYADANWVLSGKGTTSTLETVSGTKLAVNCEGGAVASGTVTYLPKIALPATAVVTVRLEEVSRADAPSSVLASAIIPVQGQQVPIQWGFVYDPNWLEPNGRYVVRATISDGGRLIWTSDTVIPFKIGSDPLEIKVVQVAQPVAPSVNLRGTSWELTSLTIGGVQTRVTTKPRPTLAFDGSRISGNSGCNGFGGSYTQNADRLQIGQVISTLRACVDDNLMKLEAMYFKTLGGTVQISSDSSSGLTLTYASGDVLVFTRVSFGAVGQVAIALPNSSWTLTAYTLGTNRVTVGVKPPTLEFDAVGRVSGYSGCNRFTGGFNTSSAGALKFTPLASTRMMCMGEANTLETAFLKILQGATRYSSDENTLKIFSSAGTLTFKRSR